MLTLVPCPICKKYVRLVREDIPRSDGKFYEFYGKHSSSKAAVCESSFADYGEADTAADVRFKRKEG